MSVHEEEDEEDEDEDEAEENSPSNYVVGRDATRNPEILFEPREKKPLRNTEVFCGAPKSSAKNRSVCGAQKYSRNEWKPRTCIQM